MKKITIFALTLVVSGCSTIDRPYMSSFRPIQIQGCEKGFEYRANADALHPESSASAEKTRIEWLETYLKDNHLGTKYTIKSRKAIFKDRALLGDGYEVFYNVCVLGNEKK